MFHYSGKGYWNKSQPLKITNKKDLHISTQGNKTSLKAAIPRELPLALYLFLSYFQSRVGAARKITPNWLQKTMTCQNSNCFSIFWGQRNAPSVTSLSSSCYMTPHL